MQAELDNLRASKDAEIRSSQKNTICDDNLSDPTTGDGSEEAPPFNISHPKVIRDNYAEVEHFTRMLDMMESLDQSSNL